MGGATRLPPPILNYLAAVNPVDHWGDMDYPPAPRGPCLTRPFTIIERQDTAARSCPPRAGRDSGSQSTRLPDSPQRPHCRAVAPKRPLPHGRPFMAQAPRRYSKSRMKLILLALCLLAAPRDVVRARACACRADPARDTADRR